MTMIGHKTRSMFERYKMVSEPEVLAAARRLDAAATKATAQSAVSGTSLDESIPVSY